ncbi:leucine-rich repeat domain-containing protein [Flavobacterium sp. EDS]|uniref:leucine-rich repeat domain-containing protein n=1 Tax=Flavobacterium sp. EDS TaxID=2897328 RepID=UPI001E4A85E5|nr:leucine-rich repeat domain-containing protein [Flavobacterium sp. EDS]MCD0475988.1 leucine-rich repeat domain-containing protein [Flavobacterium sp. EDS]
MNKPTQILDLEDKYKITISQKNKKYSILEYKNQNTFEINENLEIIGLNLSYNEILDFSPFNNLNFLRFLNLQGNNITDISFLENLVHLTHLSLGFNSISECLVLKRFINLTSLNLSSNSISDFSSLKELVNLTSLDIEGNEISDLSFLEKLTQISDLDLSNSPNITSYKILQKLSLLTSINLSNNFISDYSFVKSFKKLVSLNLSNNEISDLSFLKNSKELTFLNLSNNNISDITILKNLPITNLILGNNNISDISGFTALSRITTLDLHRNKINDITALKDLTSLINLNLNHNNISKINDLENLVNLKYLFLSENPISEISILKNLKGINSLDLSNTIISDIKVLENLIHIKKLSLSDNQISDITPLKKLKKITSLTLWSNQIRDIRPLKYLSELLYLDLSNNQIEDINPIENLTKLVNLYLDGNKISDIAVLQNHRKLKLLVLEKNNISDFRPLENQIRSNEIVLDSEKQFDIEDGLFISNNHSTIPPFEVLEQGNETVLQYFEDARQYGLKALNECKLIFVGDGGLGKTSLMKKIVGLPFTTEVTTHGINKKSWNEVINKNNEKIKVNLWDFGGQHIQHSLHQFFLTEKVIYILLLDPRNDTNVMYWLDQIDKLGKDSEVLIVYNYKDPKDKDSHNNKNFFELRKTYPKLRTPFLLSCKDDYGFDDFKTELTKTILNQKDLLVQYPLNWFKIKNELEKDVTISKNYIAYNEYDLICKNNKYTNEINKKNLLKQLDKIGSIVFFDKPILNDLQVLNPDWITTGAYSVITSEITRSKKGHLNYSNLKEIFKDEKSLFANERIKLKYKEKDFQFILALMTDYDLCVTNPFEKNEYLVPCAFEGEKPLEFDKYKNGSRRYRFQFESSFEMLIMYRFMARNISNCVKNGYWQSGIVIKDQHSETFALVETNQHSKIIDFWIKGDNIRGLWEVLRRDIKDINSKYSLEYREEVLYISKENKKQVFLSYDEMIDSLKNGVSTIDYHPTYRIRNINVLNVIDNFEDSQKILNAMNKEGQIFNFKGDFISNGNTQIGGKNNTQNSYINNYSNNSQIQELKDILEDFEDVSKDNKEWQENFCNALKELYRLEQANDEIDERKSISKLQKFFTKAKEVKDWVAIGLLPAEIATKGAKMMELGEQLFSFITK